MLTPNTIIETIRTDNMYCSVQRPTWVGTIKEAMENVLLRERLDAMLAEHAPANYDRYIDQELEDLADAGLSDCEIAARIFDDPNLAMADPEEVEAEIREILRTFNFRIRQMDSNEIRGANFAIYWSLDGEYGRFGAEWASWGIDEDGEEIFRGNGLIPYSPRTGSADEIAAKLIDMAESAARR